MNKTQKIIATTAIAVGTASIAIPANAASHDWSGVANCESSGNWHTNTGNGFFGGLQFTRSTWEAYGGHAYAPEANQASESEQIVIAERVLQGQGIGAWPVCGQYLSGGSTPETPSTGSYSADQRSSVEKAPVKTYKAPEKLQGDSYTVQTGDTLSGIGEKFGVDWNDIYKNNEKVVGSDPNMIFPGQVLVVK